MFNIYSIYKGRLCKSKAFPLGVAWMIRAHSRGLGWPESILVPVSFNDEDLVRQVLEVV